MKRSLIQNFNLICWVYFLQLYLLCKNTFTIISLTLCKIASHIQGSRTQGITSTLPPKRIEWRSILIVEVSQKGNTEGTGKFLSTCKCGIFRAKKALCCITPSLYGEKIRPYFIVFSIIAPIELRITVFSCFSVWRSCHCAWIFCILLSLHEYLHLSNSFGSQFNIWCERIPLLC